MFQNTCHLDLCFSTLAWSINKNVSAHLSSGSMFQHTGLACKQKCFSTPLLTYLLFVILCTPAQILELWNVCQKTAWIRDKKGLTTKQQKSGLKKSVQVPVTNKTSATTKRRILGLLKLEVPFISQHPLGLMLMNRCALYCNCHKCQYCQYQCNPNCSSPTHCSYRRYKLIQGRYQQCTAVLG